MQIKWSEMETSSLFYIFHFADFFSSIFLLEDVGDGEEKLCRVNHRHWLKKIKYKKSVLVL